MTRPEKRALALARRGLAVFPLQPPSAGPHAKKPLPGSHGHRDATTDETRIREWWAEHPEANVGLAPDACRPRLLVVDADPKNGGLESLEALKDQGLISDTLTVRTPSGGLHLYYRYPDDAADPVRSSAGRLGPGLDVRGAGGYVVAPGSTVEGREYTVEDRRGFAEAPPALLEACGRAEERRPEADQWLVDPDLEANVEAASRWLETTTPAIQGRGGHDHTYQTAAMLRDRGISQAKALDLMLESWNDRCEPPWEPEELATVVGNAYRYARRPAGTEAPSRAQELLSGDGEPTKAEDPEPAGRPSRFRLVSAAEVITRPPPEWLVREVVPETGLGLLMGSYGSYKSFLALDLAMHVALGRPWAGREVAQGPVVYVVGEGGRGVRNRLRAWLRDNDEDLPPDDLHLVEAMPLFDGPAEIQELVNEIRGRRVRPRLVILDTVARAMAGMDENSFQAGSTFVRYADELWRLLGCALLGVHHYGKDEKRGSRGHTVIPAATEYLLGVAASSSRREAHLRLARSKDAEEWRDPAVFRARLIDLGRGENSLAFRHAPGAAARPTDEESMAQMRWDAVVRVLTAPGAPSDPLPTRVLAEQVARETTAEGEMPEEGTPAYRQLVGSAQRWLQREAKTPEGQRWILSGTGGRDGALWRAPADFDPRDGVPEVAD